MGLVSLVVSCSVMSRRVACTVVSVVPYMLGAGVVGGVVFGDVAQGGVHGGFGGAVHVDQSGVGVVGQPCRSAGGGEGFTGEDHGGEGEWWLGGVVDGL
ncbi:hypothetical protein DSM43519_04064 [Mycobacterium marinum]|nr:hypothetical protein DSM43519_04064 [Mycobacterium marinum]RFZ23139.1 hypothetical protein NCTC2275_05620 [Mycobacterium marinum]